MLEIYKIGRVVKDKTLKPCPFCGSQAVINSFDWERGTNWIVECSVKIYAISNHKLRLHLRKKQSPLGTKG